MLIRVTAKNLRSWEQKKECTVALEIPPMMPSIYPGLMGSSSRRSRVSRASIRRVRTLFQNFKEINQIKKRKLKLLFKKSRKLSKFIFSQK